jgi:putative endonuclease
MEKRGYIYILTNNNNSTLYIGVTSNLQKRIHQHKNHLVDGFSKKYNLVKLVYYEIIDSMYEAIKREKQLKAGSRKKKIELINLKNPNWNDLFQEIF